MGTMVSKSGWYQSGRKAEVKLEDSRQIRYQRSVEDSHAAAPEVRRVR